MKTPFPSPRSVKTGHLAVYLVRSWVCAQLCLAERGQGHRGTWGDLGEAEFSRGPARLSGTAVKAWHCRNREPCCLSQSSLPKTGACCVPYLCGCSPRCESRWDYESRAPRRARTHRFGKRGGQAGLQNSHPSPGERRWGAGSKLGSGLGREHLVKTLMHLVGINPRGKEAAKEDPYDKGWEHGAPSDPGCDSTHRVSWGPQTYGPLRSPLRRSRNRTVLLFFKLFSQTILFLPPRCIVLSQAINTRSMVSRSASGSI